MPLSFKKHGTQIFEYFSSANSYSLCPRNQGESLRLRNDILPGKRAMQPLPPPGHPRNVNVCKEEFLLFLLERGGVRMKLKCPRRSEKRRLLWGCINEWSVTNFCSRLFTFYSNKKQSGAVEACWAHNPEVRRSKLRSANTFFITNLFL